jgi:hypothetical protein
VGFSSQWIGCYSQPPKTLHSVTQHYKFPKLGETPTPDEIATTQKKCVRFGNSTVDLRKIQFYKERWTLNMDAGNEIQFQIEYMGAKSGMLLGFSLLTGLRLAEI